MKINLLSNEQIQRLHEASLHILANVGVHVPHEEMLRLLAEAGAEVDKHTQRVKLPEKLVQESLARAGKRFAIYGRDRSRRAEFGAGRRDMAARCREMRDRLLQERVPTPMDPDTLRAVDQLLADARRHLGP